MPRPPDGTPARGVPRFGEGTPARGVPRTQGPAATPGAVRPTDGTPGRGVPRFADGTPARGVPRAPEGTPSHGVPRLPDGTPARGVPQVRGEHPQQREDRGGRGGPPGRPGAGRSGSAPGATVPQPRRSSRARPLQEYVDAFDGQGDAGDDDHDVFAPRSTVTAHRSGPHPSTTEREPETGADDAPPAGPPALAPPGGAKGRTYTGIAAAAVTTVLAVIVAGQVAHRDETGGADARSTAGQGQETAGSASGEPSPSVSARVVALTYDQKMAKKYALGATLKGPDKFDAVPGSDKAPGKGKKYTYRVDVERGLGLDGTLFAQAVQKTLNDDRSWAHGGARTFARVSSGRADFVITLASPGTTARWCAKSGLDTTEDNVSCDSASTERVMINAYRWAQGSTTYGDKMYAYRQMLINHEVGHRLGYGHVTCDRDGELAPVMQQQTKFLDHDGIHCLPNPWPYPGS
ncbi:DUF3152 domain-containing protein [Streptomyces sp. NPDC005423]|uniref:DUF3152 domain-containing protein n=1 Tax=Streptomyces sp. NPDC005423 TaxID=3155343 RepID=UPI0033B64810